MKRKVYNKTQRKYNLNIFLKNKAKRTLLRQRTCKWSKWTENKEEKALGHRKKTIIQLKHLLKQ